MMEKLPRATHSVARGLKKVFGKEEYAESCLKKNVTESHQPRAGVVMPFAHYSSLMQTEQQ